MDNDTRTGAGQRKRGVSDPERPRRVRASGRCDLRTVKAFHGDRNCNCGLRNKKLAGSEERVWGEKTEDG